MADRMMFGKPEFSGTPYAKESEYIESLKSGNFFNAEEKAWTWCLQNRYVAPSIRASSVKPDSPWFVVVVPLEGSGISARGGAAICAVNEPLDWIEVARRILCQLSTK